MDTRSDWVQLTTPTDHIWVRPLAVVLIGERRENAGNDATRRLLVQGCDEDVWVLDTPENLRKLGLG